MANPFFQSGEQRAEKVKALFGGIAPRYDLLNDIQSFGLHRYWKWRVVRLAHVEPGNRALDVCCGTGDIANALAQAGATVVGVDFSEEMLAVAASRCGRLVSPQVETPTGANASSNPAFVKADAQHLPFPDKSFDVVTVGYGLRNLASWETGLREMERVAKPGGRLVVLDFGKPDFSFWRALYFGYLRLAVPLLGRIFAGRAQAYSYILESLKHYPGQRAVAAKMAELGLVNVKIINLLGGAMSINYAEKRSN